MVPTKAQYEVEENAYTVQENMTCIFCQSQWEELGAVASAIAMDLYILTTVQR